LQSYIILFRNIPSIQRTGNERQEAWVKANPKYSIDWWTLIVRKPLIMQWLWDECKIIAAIKWWNAAHNKNIN
jgi:hypothetical protein